MANIDPLTGEPDTSPDGRSAYDIAHTPDGPGAPAPNWAGMPTGKTVANWNDPSQMIDSVTGESKGRNPAVAGSYGNAHQDQYESLINSLVGKLNQPQSNPGFGPMMDYLNSYFQQQGKGQGYTPAQMAQFQTQALDPLERDHQAARQRVIEQMGARGMSPSSGPTIQALLQVDQQYETLGQQQRSQIASSGANLGIQQQQQAAQLGPLIASLYQGQNNLGNQNALQAVELAGLLPQMDRQSIQTAQGVLQPINPMSLLDPLLGAQAQGYNQSAGFANQLMQALMLLYSQPQQRPN